MGPRYNYQDTISRTELAARGIRAAQVVLDDKRKILLPDIPQVIREESSMHISVWVSRHVGLCLDFGFFCSRA